MKTKLYLTMAALMIAPTLAFAQGSGSQGGHGVKDKTTGKVRVADDYVIREEDPAEDQIGERYTFDRELRNEVEKALRIMAVYAQIAPTPLKDGGYTYWGPYNLWVNEFRKNVLAADYRLVDAIPKDCVVENPRFNSVPENNEIKHLACTLGKQTFLVRDMFLNMVSAREKTKSIIHERLHDMPAFKVLNAESKIADITQGLELAMDLMDQQVAGARPVLTDKQIQTLKQMQKRLHTHWVFGNATDADPTFYRREIYIQGSEITAHGGGIIGPDVKTGTNVYIGIATMLSRARVGDNVALIDSAWFCAPPTSSALTTYDTRWCKIGSDVSVIQSHSVMAQFKTKIGNQVTVKNFASYTLMDLILEDRTTIENSSVDMIADQQYQRRHFRLRLSEGSSLKNLKAGRVHYRAKDLGAGVSIVIAGFGSIPALVVAGTGQSLIPAFAVGAAILRTLPAVYVSYYALKIKGEIDASDIDCSGDKVFRDNLGLRAVIETKEDLIRRCKKK